MRNDYKKDIIAAFSNASGSYNDYATIPKLAAEKLIASLEPWLDLVPRGPILEVGCGTGLVTERLLPLFPGREFFITDISEYMLDVCKENLERRELLGDNIRFQVMDGEEIKEKSKYALIISGFTIQWFRDAMTGGYNLVDALVPTGLFIFSFPGSRSFFQWKSACEELGIAYTCNKLPEIDRLGVQFSMKPVLLDSYDEIYSERYQSALNFFRTLKKTGAYVRKNGEVSLSVGQLRKLIAHMDDKSKSVIEIGYHLAYMAIRKNEAG